MASEALVTECINKGIDTGVESDDDDADDVSDVAVFLILVIIVEHVDDQHRKPCDGVHNTHLWVKIIKSTD